MLRSAVGGRRAGEWSGGGGERLAKRTGAQRRRRAADGSPPLMRWLKDYRSRRVHVECDRADERARSKRSVRWSRRGNTKFSDSDNYRMIQEVRWQRGKNGVARMRTFLGHLKYWDTTGLWLVHGRGLSVIVVCSCTIHVRGLCTESSMPWTV